MNLSVGIVGLPNVGKSTLFNALLKRQAALAANYPFTTIEPNVGVVMVPDARLEKLVELVKPEKVTPATVSFIDIAGLVKNAHQGQGLGNEFLGHIRDVNAIVHVIREFEDPQVLHVMGGVGPDRDREIIKSELEIAGIDKPMIEWVNKSKVEFEKVEGLIEKAYRLLDLVTFYTIKGGKEVRAWSLKRGRTMLDAAELVHTDFARHFIKAEVIPFQDLIRSGGWKNAQSNGKIRLEGKEAIVQDGDVIEFKIGR